MRTKIIIKTALFSILFLGCKSGINIDQAFKDSLSEKYPHAKHIEWDYDDGDIVAEFWDEGIERKVWFDQSGEWMKSKADIPFSKLPEEVKMAFTNSQYANWKIEDIHFLEIGENMLGENPDSFYEFKIEEGRQELTFAVYPDGTMATFPS